MRLGVPELIVIPLIVLAVGILPLLLACWFGYNSGYRRGLQKALESREAGTQR